MRKRPSLKSQIEDEYIYDDLSSSQGELSKKDKKELKKEKRLRHQLKGKKKKWEASNSIFFASTIALLIIALIIWALALLVAPDHKIPATISATVGGFNIEYPMLTQELHQFPEDVKQGDEFFMTDWGRITTSRRNNLKVTVKEIKDDQVILQVVNAELPTFLSMDDFLAYFKDSGKKQFSSIYIHGKIAGGRFVLSKVTTQ